MAGTIDSALDLYGNALRGTASQRAAFLSTAVDGMLWQDTDGIRMIWRKDGALWVPAVLRWRGTTAQMNSFGANAPDGFEWFSTTDNSEYVRVGGAWQVRGSRITPNFGTGFASRGHTIIYDPGLKTVSVSFNARHSAVPTNGATVLTIPGIPGAAETRYYPGIAAEAGTPVPCFFRITGASVSVWQTNTTAAASGSVYGGSFEYTVT